MKHSWCQRSWMMAALLAACTSVGRAMSVSPPRTEIRVPPGGKSTAVITITNTHPEAYDVEVSEKPWFVYPDNRGIPVDAWLKLPFVRHFRLKPGQSRGVKITVHCPTSATGELMGMVSFAYQASKESIVTPMISTAVYLEIIGTEKNTGDVLAFGAGIRDGKLQVGVKIKATGNVRLRPSGRIYLLDEQGQRMADYVVGEATPIFPGSVKEYEGKGPTTVPPAGRYRLSADLTSGTLHLQSETGLVIESSGTVKMEAAKP